MKRLLQLLVSLSLLTPYTRVIAESSYEAEEINEDRYVVYQDQIVGCLCYASSGSQFDDYGQVKRATVTMPGSITNVVPYSVYGNPTSKWIYFNYYDNYGNVLDTQWASFTGVSYDWAYVGNYCN